jgi:hypothetical protein
MAKCLADCCDAHTCFHHWELVGCGGNGSVQISERMKEACDNSSHCQSQCCMKANVTSNATCGKFLANQSCPDFMRRRRGKKVDEIECEGQKCLEVCCEPKPLPPLPPPLWPCCLWWRLFVGGECLGAGNEFRWDRALDLCVTGCDTHCCKEKSPGPFCLDWKGTCMLPTVPKLNYATIPCNPAHRFSCQFECCEWHYIPPTPPTPTPTPTPTFNCSTYLHRHGGRCSDPKWRPVDGRHAVCSTDIECLKQCCEPNNCNTFWKTTGCGKLRQLASSNLTSCADDTECLGMCCVQTCGSYLNETLCLGDTSPKPNTTDVECSPAECQERCCTSESTCADFKCGNATVAKKPLPSGGCKDPADCQLKCCMSSPTDCAFFWNTT